MRGSVTGMGGGIAGDADETAREKTTRKWNELLQELRVAQTGVQILTGFLLTLPFTQRFEALDRIDKAAYLITVAASISSAGLLIAPAAFHRVLFGRSEKEWLISSANRVARGGLALLGVTMGGVVFLVFDVVSTRPAAWTATGITIAVLGSLWFIVPALGGDNSS